MEPSSQSTPQPAPYGDPPQDPSSASVSTDRRGSGAKVEKIGPGRARTGLVVLLSFLLELVVIAGYGNQYVTKHVRGHLKGDTLGSHLYIAGQTFSWRFSPPKGDSGHAWLAQLMLPVSFLVLSALLIAVVVRGSVTFGRAFFGVWAVVLFSTVAACYVRGGILAPVSSAANRADSLLFFTGPGSPEVLAGLALGLVVAFLAAILTVATRRPAPTALPPGLIAVSPLPDPDQPPPYFGETDPSDRTRPLYGDRSATERPQPTGYHFDGEDAGARHAAGPPEVPAEATSRLPALDEDGTPRESAGAGVMAGAAGGAGAAYAAADAEGQTTQLPVVDPDRGGSAPRPTREQPAGSVNRPSEQAAPEPVTSEQAVPQPPVASETGASETGASETGEPDTAAPDTAAPETDVEDARPSTPSAVGQPPPEPAIQEPAAAPRAEPVAPQVEPDAPQAEPGAPQAEPDAAPATSEPASEPAAAESEVESARSDPAPAQPAESEPASPSAAAEPPAAPQPTQPTQPETTRFAEPPSASRPVRTDESPAPQFPRPPDDDDLAADHDLHQ